MFGRWGKNLCPVSPHSHRGKKDEEGKVGGEAPPLLLQTKGGKGVGLRNHGPGKTGGKEQNDFEGIILRLSSPPGEKREPGADKDVDCQTSGTV